MANGATVRLPCEPAAPADGESAAPSVPSDLELAVRKATADAAVLIICAVTERQDGGLTPATRAKSGTALARLHKIRSSVGEDKFSILLQREGREELRNIGVSDKISGVILSWLLEDLLPKVAAAVRRMN